MRVKRFVAPTMQEAMIKVKLDMGKDAVIIHTRKFKEGGFLGWFSKLMVEVTAALEDNASAEKPGEKTAQKPENQPPVPTAKVEPKTEQLEQVESENLAVQQELAEMRALMEKMSEQLEQGQNIDGYPPVLQKFYHNLVTNDVEEQLAKKLLKKLRSKLTPEELAQEEQVCKNLLESVEKILKQVKPITFNKSNNKRQNIALVGPTGVGKTTTIAKLAATFSIVDKRRVALITADTYRIAAVEQLKTFGEIIGVPVDVVYTPTELKDAIQKHADMDLILIDTAGRSHKNVMQMSELRGFLEAAEPSDIFLVLSSTTKSKDMLDIVESYQDVAVSRLVFTKLDETSSYGAILNVINKTKKALSYVTVGQSVPDDIEVANSAKLANLMIKEK